MVVPRISRIPVLNDEPSEHVVEHDPRHVSEVHKGAQVESGLLSPLCVALKQGDDQQQKCLEGEEVGRSQDEPLREVEYAQLWIIEGPKTRQQGNDRESEDYGVGAIKMILRNDTYMSRPRDIIII